MGISAAMLRAGRTLRDWLWRFRSNKGNVVTVFALSLPLLIGGAAFSVETSYWYFKGLQLQAAADAAAYTGAIEKRAGSNKEAVTAAAQSIAEANGFDAAAGTIAVNTPPTSGPNQTALAVEVILTEPAERFFTRIFSTETVTERARAVATFLSAGNACILALSPTASKSVNFGGNTGVNVKGCDVMSNSGAIDAINTQGSSVTKAGCFIAVGGINTSGGSVQLDCPGKISGAPALADPFQSLPVPTASGGCKNDNSASLSPGRYCHGMDLKDTVHLDPGVYYVEGGDFKVNANAIVTGAGVTIYLSGTSRVSMNGNSTTQLSAPTDGTYAGILFFGDRSNTGGTKNSYNGTNASTLTGYLYHKGQPVQYAGNFSGTKGCTRVVADTIEWTGNTTIDDTQDCSTLGLKKTPTSELITLKE